MTKDLMIMALGGWIAILSFLGFPSRVDTYILLASGVIIIVLTLLLRRDFVRYIERMKRHMPHAGDVFVESSMHHDEPEEKIPPSPPSPEPKKEAVPQAVAEPTAEHVEETEVAKGEALSSLSLARKKPRARRVKRISFKRAARIVHEKTAKEE